MTDNDKSLAEILRSQPILKLAGSNSADDACPDCGGSGWIFGEDRARRCDCLKRQIRAERQKKFDAEIPPRFRSCSREGWKGTWPLTLPLTWVPTPGKSPWAVVVWGPPGTGKTHAATALYRELLARFEHLAGMWLSTEEMVSRVKGEAHGDLVTQLSALRFARPNVGHSGSRCGESAGFRLAGRRKEHGRNGLRLSTLPLLSRPRLPIPPLRHCYKPNIYATSGPSVLAVRSRNFRPELREKCGISVTIGAAA